MYVLSSGELTSSRKLYLQDALRFAFSINSFSVPNSELGVSIVKEDLNAAYKLLFTNTCKAIDTSLSVSDMKIEKDRIRLIINYPYGELGVDVET